MIRICNNLLSFTKNLLPIQKLSKSCEAAREKWRDLAKEPPPLGPLLQKTGEASVAQLGWHAGPEHQLTSQIKGGVFKNIGKPLYIAPGDASIALHFVKDDPGPSVLIAVGGDPTQVHMDLDDRYNTVYLDPGKGEIRILQVYKVNTEWKLHKGLPLGQRVGLCFGAFSAALAGI